MKTLLILLMLAGAMGAQGQEVIFRNLLAEKKVARWKLDGNGTDAWGTNTLTSSGSNSVGFVAGVNGSCARTTNGLAVMLKASGTNIVNWSGPWTCSLWFQCWSNKGATRTFNAAGAAYNSTSSASNAWNVQLNENAASAVVYVNTNATMRSTTVSIGQTVGKWQHFTIVYRPSVQRLDFYKNGAYLSTASALLMLQLITNGVAPFVLLNDADGRLHGNWMVDDVCLWEQALNAQEVQKLYNRSNYLAEPFGICGP